MIQFFSVFLNISQEKRTSWKRYWSKMAYWNITSYTKVIFFKRLQQLSIQEPILFSREKFEIYSVFSNEVFSGTSNFIFIA